MSGPQRRAVGLMADPELDSQSVDSPSGQRAKDMGLPSAMEADKEAGAALAASIRKRREDMGVAQVTEEDD